MRSLRGWLVAACVLLALTAAPRSAQERLADLESLALLSPYALAVDPGFQCGTGMDWAIQMRLATAEPLATGEPLFFEQEPRLLRADYTGDIRFANFQVVGDFETVKFELLDPEQQTETGGNVYKEETWQRTGTKSVAGQVISIFNPSWPNSIWETYLRRRNLQNSEPLRFWGRFIVPTSQVATAEGDEVVRRDVFVNTTTTNIPSSTVTKINDTVQFASHVVNIVKADFGDSQVGGGRYDLQLQDIAKLFYEHFQDAYDSLAIVSHSQQVTTFGAFHRNVKNEIQGLGATMPLFDNTGQYGSAGILKSVEFYPYNTFGSNGMSNHEIGHQYVDFWDWSKAAGGIERKGHAPDAHTPLLFPGEVFTGAVLYADRRVKEQTAPGPAAHGPVFDIERTPTPNRLHSTTLYRMGLIPASDVATMQVFDNQGQFDAETSSSPTLGTVLIGGHREVHINALMAREGTRSGPVYTEWRRATIVVSRGGLLPREEMDYWNSYAARAAAQEGVSSYTGNPSYFEATGGRVRLKSDINPKTAGKINETPAAGFASLGTNDWRGVRFDSPVPGRTTIAQASTSGIAALSKTVTLSGIVTATDRTDFNAVCVRPRRDAMADPNELFKCFSISGNRFTTSLTFEEQHRGAYILDVFLFWPDSGSQYPRTANGILYVD